MEGIQLSDIINMEDPESVFDEAKEIAFRMFPEIDFAFIVSSREIG